MLRVNKEGLFNNNKTFVKYGKRFGGTNTNTPDTDYHQQIIKYNETGHFLWNFTRSNSVHIIWRLKDHSHVVLQKAANPYDEGDAQVVGIPADAAQKNIRNISGITSVDLSPEAQYKYWQIVLAELKAIEQLPLPDRIKPNAILDMVEHIRTRRQPQPKAHKISIENATPLSRIDARYKDATGVSPQTSKTIYAAHSHGSVTIHSSLKEEDWHIAHLDKERQTMHAIQHSSYGEQFFNRVYQLMLEGADSKELRSRIQKHVTITIEEGTPVGYSLDLKDFTLKQSLKKRNIRFLVAISNLHTTAYTRAIQELQQQISQAKEKGLPTPIQPEDISMPQPAFRTYSYYVGESKGNRTLQIRVSPSLSSHAGAKEVANVKLERSPDYVPSIPDQQVAIYEKRLRRRVWSLTWWDRTYEDKRLFNKDVRRVELRGWKPTIVKRRKYYSEPDLP